MAAAGTDPPWSAHPENAGAPARCGVVAAAGIAAGGAVSGTEIAFAALVHAVLQFHATRLEPIRRAHGGRIQAKAARLAFTEITEVVVGFDLVLEIAHAQLDHDRVVQIAQYRH